MSNMDTVGAGASASVKEERFAALIAVENELKVAVREDDSSAQEAMRLLPCHTFEAVQQRLVDLLGPKLLHELRVVNRLDDAVRTNLSGDLKPGFSYIRFSSKLGAAPTLYGSTVCLPVGACTGIGDSLSASAFTFAAMVGS